MRTKKLEWDFEIKFWKDWLYADALKRLDMVENLPILKEIESLARLSEKMRGGFLAQLLNSYFEDLESAVYTKIRIEGKKNGV